MNYKAFWTDVEHDKKLRDIKSSMEIILDQLSNSRKREVLAKAEEFPILIKSARPFKTNSMLAKAIMYLFPIGVVLWAVSLPFELRIKNDLKNVQRLSDELSTWLQTSDSRETFKTAIA